MVTLVPETTKVEESTKVLAPAPAVNVWQVKKVTSSNTVNDESWPTLVETLKQDIVPEKSISTKSVGKGQWKPYTPTIIHPSPNHFKREKDNRNPRESTQNTPAYNASIEKPVPEIQSNNSFRSSGSFRGNSNRRGRGRENYSRRFYKPKYFDMETLKLYILQQIEYYFSIDNLCKDLYLRSQMNPDGYVPFTLIASFNRVKNLTTDMDLIRASLELSQLLEKDQGGHLLRKKEGWETWVLPAAKKTVTPVKEVKKQVDEPQKTPQHYC